MQLKLIAGRWIVAALLAVTPALAVAQTATVVTTCGTGTTYDSGSVHGLQQNTAGQLCVVPVTGAGGAAPADAHYVTTQAESGLSAETVTGTGVATWLATPSSANLATALTDETGTGAAVFAGAPAFTGTVTFGTGNLQLAIPSSGVATLLDSAGTSFTRLQLGGTTSSFPSIKRNGSGIDFRKADDSAFSTVSVGQIELNAGTDTSITRVSAGIIAVEGKTVPVMLTGSATFDPPSLLTLTGSTTTVTVTGAILGDVAVGSFSLDLQGEQVTYYISAADTCTARFFDSTAGTLDLASGTLKCLALR